MLGGVGCKGSYLDTTDKGTQPHCCETTHTEYEILADCEVLLVGRQLMGCWALSLAPGLLRSHAEATLHNNGRWFC